MAKVVVQGTAFDPLIKKATAALSGYTPGSMQKTATREATGLLAPQIAGQNAQNAAAQQLLSNLYNRQTGFSLALAKLANPNAEEAMKPYLAGADALANLGQGISGAVGQDWQNAAQQATETARGLTDQGFVKAAYDPTGLQASGYTTGFALPGASLADQAITAAAEARNRQVASASELGVLAGNTQAQQIQQAADNARALATIRAQLPGLVSKSLSDQRTLRQGAFDTLSTLVGNRANILSHRADRAATAKQHLADLAETHRANLVNETISWQNAATQAGYLGQAGAQLKGKVTAQNLANRATEASLTGYDPVTGNLMPGYITVKGRPVRLSDYTASLNAQYNIDSLKAKAAAGGLTAGEQSTLRKAATDLVGTSAKTTSPSKRMITTKDPKTGDVKVSWVDVPGTGKADPMDYADVLDQVIQMGPDTPDWRAKAIKIVQANPAYATPGQHGRPYEGKGAIEAARKLALFGLTQGFSPEQILANARASGLIPESALIPVLNQLRRGARITGAIAGSAAAGLQGFLPAGGKPLGATKAGTGGKLAASDLYWGDAASRYGA